MGVNEQCCGCNFDNPDGTCKELKRINDVLDWLSSEHSVEDSGLNKLAEWANRQVTQGVLCPLREE